MCYHSSSLTLKPFRDDLSSCNALQLPSSQLVSAFASSLWPFDGYLGNPKFSKRLFKANSLHTINSSCRPQKTPFLINKGHWISSLLQTIQTHYRSPLKAEVKPVLFGENRGGWRKGKKVTRYELNNWWKSICVLETPTTCCYKMKRDRAGPLVTATPGLTNHIRRKIPTVSTALSSCRSHMLAGNSLHASRLHFSLNRCQNALQKYDMTLSSFYRQENWKAVMGSYFLRMR